MNKGDLLGQKIFRLFISILSSHVNEFWKSNVKQKLSSAQNIICITAIADKKIKRSVCIFAALCPSSVCCAD